MPFFGNDIISVPPDRNKIFHPGHHCVCRIVRGGSLSHGPVDATPSVSAKQRRAPTCSPVWALVTHHNIVYIGRVEVVALDHCVQHRGRGRLLEPNAGDSTRRLSWPCHLPVAPSL